jgi:hypothetical protein
MFFCYRKSPPLFAVVLSTFDLLTLGFPWIATMYYGYKICPPDLVGTMASMSVMFQWVIGKFTNHVLYKSYS